MTPPGHLFIVRGDLTRLACDGFLLPCDAALRVSSGSWLDGTGLESEPFGTTWVRVLNVEPPDPFGLGDAVRVERPAGHPTPWLTNTALHGAARSALLTPPEAEELTRATLMTFLERVSREYLHGHYNPLHGRCRPLVAIPMIGTGTGGGIDTKGPIARAHVETVLGFTERHPIDIAIVLNDQQSYDAAQHGRRDVMIDGFHEDDALADAWHLTPEMVDSARDIALHASAGRLVVFAGAGISTGAGLPGWEQLLRNIATGLGGDPRRLGDQPTGADLARFAQDLRSTVDDEQAFRRAVARSATTTRHALAHGLIASLCANEIITTNFDDLIEVADRGADNPQITVLPTAARAEAERWLLKLHGTADHPRSIVLTDEDFERLQRDLPALAGLVQGMLLTRHVLFVGYSLRDPDFLTSLRQVRSAINHAADRAAHRDEPVLGTALLPYRASEQADEFTLTRVGPLEDRPGDDDGGRRALAEAVRQCDIYLDLVNALAFVPRSFILDPTYDGMLPHHLRTLREPLAALAHLLETDDALRRAPAAGPIVELLHAYGWEAPA